ncbi:hypothetical protein NQ166_14350 [Microbacterium sp. zg.Y1090]|uniref:hypothetical protein n=1 Tax=Microbacterium wangruii TaxID=3049073 RepID=UPI00214D83AC|nr:MULTISPECIES: hypothetical protein [unclassified Microbacterium]MCR2820008.1 hypothetical protein [Microbacterium sp. zg.Y1090]WIM27977.1 hypothetical protein QNO26_12615 [Microbacterium sp. zg-Y1090]
MRRGGKRAGGLIAILLIAAGALTGCGPAPWTTAPESEAEATPRATAPVPAPVASDLSGGSTQRELTAGAVSATVDYWSDLSMDRWTPTGVKPLSMSMVTTVTPNDGQKVYLQKATMNVVPANAAETFETLDPQADAATVSPGYLVLSPYSYSQTFNVGSVPDDATFVTVQFTFDFLVQTTPTSSEYAKQTATDVLTIAIAAPPAAAE